MSIDGFSPELVKEMQEEYAVYTNPDHETGYSYSPKKELFNVDKVRAVAEEVISKLGSFVYKWELCGGARRGNPMVHDGDIVVWLAYEVEPDTMKNFQAKLVEVLADQVQEGNVRFIEETLKIADPDEKKKKKRKVKAKPKPPRKIYRFRYDGIPVEIYLAKDEKQFEVLKFVRTGTPEFHRDLLIRAQNMGMTLRFSHDETLDIDLYGLYGAIQSWTTDKTSGRRRHEWVINPARLVAWKEQHIIESVFGVFIPPADREPGRY